MEHHFVVKYDTETDTFVIDDVTAHAVLPDGPIWDRRPPGEWRMDDYEDGHAEVAAVLASLLAADREYVTVRR
jgi:hypothetical protein